MDDQLYPLLPTFHNAPSPLPRLPGVLPEPAVARIGPVGNEARHERALRRTVARPLAGEGFRRAQGSVTNASVGDPSPPRSLVSGLLNLSLALAAPLRHNHSWSLCPFLCPSVIFRARCRRFRASADETKLQRSPQIRILCSSKGRHAVGLFRQTRPAHGQRTGDRGWQWKCAAFPVHGTWGLPGPRAVPPVGQTRATLKEAIRSIAPSLRGHPDAARAGQFQAGQSSTACPALRSDSTVSVVSRNRMNRARRAKMRRSESGAAVRHTRGGELGCGLGFVCSSGAKTGYGFRSALGQAGGRALGCNLVRERVARFLAESPSSARATHQRREGGAPRTNPTD